MGEFQNKGYLYILNLAVLNMLLQDNLLHFGSNIKGVRSYCTLLKMSVNTELLAFSWVLFIVLVMVVSDYAACFNYASVR